MFFSDTALPTKRQVSLRALPPVPATGWLRPDAPPRLDGAVRLALDCETREPDFAAGPGWGRSTGYIVGVSLAAEDALGNIGKWYFPVRHNVEQQDNLEPEKVFPWLKTVLETSTPKVGANLLYDIGWLTTEDINVDGPLYDVQYAEALLDEYALVGLDALARKYLSLTKTTDELYKWLREAYPLTPKTATRENIWRAPPRLVGSYAEDDAALPLKIMPCQTELMNLQGLTDVFRMECDLIPLLIRMRLEGVTVNVGKAVDLKAELEEETAKLYETVRTEYGNLDSTSSGNIGKLFDKLTVPYPRKHGKPSIEKEYLADLEHPVAKLLLDIREREKICGTFLQSYIIDKHVPVSGSNSLGKIHPQFHPLRGESGGTRVGRFASSTPNWQNVPARTKLGKRVRELCEPDQHHADWYKLDYSQIHYRILAHYAVDDGDGSADKLRQTYIDNPRTDYHFNVLTNVAPLMNWDITDDEHNDFVRRPIKNVNFGLLYGQSIKSLGRKTASYFGSAFTEAQVKGFFDAYFSGAPYVKPTMKAIGEEVQLNGYTTSILGRRCRFHEWEPAIQNRGEWEPPLPYDLAVATYGPYLRRAYEYRGVNYKFQSSEPDLMKMGMLHCVRSGVFDYTGVPRLTVHDELNFSARDRSPQTEEAFRFIQHTLGNSVKLRVPVLVDMERGANWGNVKVFN